MADKEHRIFDIGISLTDRCGHGCRHCSTNASLGAEKTSVPFPVLEKAFGAMAPHTQVLSISCEGDPFFYGSEGPSKQSARDRKTIVDVVGLAGESGFEEVTVQFYPPRPDRFPMLEEILGAVEEVRKTGKRFSVLPLISFHLFGASNGLAGRTRNQEGKRRLELYAPGVAGKDAEDWFARTVSRLPLSAKAARLGSGTLAFLDSVYETILTFASRRIPVHFELRGDSGPFTNVELANAVLDMILKKLELDHPEVPFPTCEECGKVHYSRTSGHILPLGRAAGLFFDGRRLEARLCEDHIQVNAQGSFCPNWTSRGVMTIDTKGYPQLCYSNIALTPKCRTTKGPNLYRDGFEAIRKFTLRVWEDRRQFLAQNRPLFDKVPHDLYCPLPRFRAVCREFLLDA